MYWYAIMRNRNSRALNATRRSALTDSLIAGLANGQTSYKLVGRYISTPLRW